MKLTDFKIKADFEMSGQKWRCTDIGTRTVTAIKLDKDDLSLYHGPPYAVEEISLDEYDLLACEKL